jgi:acyl-CoA reductase-like NAD-dependent aldehyde dehydrogenase
VQALRVLRPAYPYYLANAALAPNHDLEVRDKYTGDVATRVPLADAAAIETAIAGSVAAAPAMAALAAFERRDVLLHCASRFKDRAEELALALCVEAGKPPDSRIARRSWRSRCASRRASRSATRAARSRA